MNVTRRLLTSELRLLLREPLVLAFVFAFPVITVLVLGGVFDDDDPAFEGALPSDYYIAAYFGVVIAAVGLIMLPVHIASYREAGVLRRFDAAGFPRWSFPLSQFVIGAVFVAIGAVILLATAAVAYGLPGVEDPARTAVGIVAGSLAFISIGVLLGTLLPNARAAQGVGLLLFLPMFLLAGGGPPPEVMSPVMNDIGDRAPADPCRAGDPGAMARARHRHRPPRRRGGDVRGRHLGDAGPVGAGRSGRSWPAGAAVGGLATRR